MKQIRIQKKKVKRTMDHHEVLPLDPRDPEVLRAKQALYTAPSDRKAA